VNATMRTLTRALAAAALTIAIAGPQALPAQDARARETPPAPGTPKDFRIPAARSFTLSNGMKVTLVPFGTVPKVAARLAVRTGGIDEGSNEVWLSNLTADLMNEGTTSRTAEQLAIQLAGMGGSVSASAGPDAVLVQGEVLSENAVNLIRIVADLARNPSFPASELERLRANRLRSLAISRSQPQSLAQEKFRQAMYGDHPYGRIFPTAEMLQAFTLEQIRGFHARNFGAARAHLFVAGVFDAAAVERAVRQAFGDWARGPAPTVSPPTPSTARTLETVNRPDAVQSTLYMGLPVPDPSHRDWVALQVTNSLLGGSFASRITSNIREDKGYTYSPFSSVSARYRDAHWVQAADVTTNVTGPSLKEIFHEVERLQQEAPSAEELRGIQNNMAGVFTVQNSSRAGIIGQLQFVDLHGLGSDYLGNYVKRVLAVTPEEVSRITRAYIDPSKMTMVVVGDQKVIEEQIAPYGTITP
jgi:zinc protease